MIIKEKYGLARKRCLKGRNFYLQNSLHKRTFKFSRKMKNYRPEICQIFHKVEVAT